MASQITDMRCYLPGRPPEDWPAAFTGGTTDGFRIMSTDPDPPEAARLVCMPVSADLTGIRWGIADAIAGDVDHDTQEVCLSVALLTTDDQVIPGLRLSGSAGAEDGYGVQIVSGNLSPIRLVSGAAGFNLAASVAGFGLARFWLRFRVEDVAGVATCSLKIWLHGATEPGSWGLVDTDKDAPAADGGIGLLSQSATAGYEVHSFGWATGGATAPGEESIEPSLWSVLANPGAKLLWTARVESYDLTERAEKVEWFVLPSAKPNNKVRDYPSAPHIRALLISASLNTDALGEDEIFGGRAERNVSSIVFDNQYGTFKVRSREYAGRVVTLYLGGYLPKPESVEPDHVWHVPITSAVIAANPEILVQEGRASLQLSATNDEASAIAAKSGTALSRQRARLLRRFPRLNRPCDVNRFVGIPIALLAGIVTIPAWSGYQIKSFTVFHRFLIDNEPVSTQRVSGIESSSTARQWRVDIGTDGRLRLTASVGGVADVVDISTTKSVVGPWGWYAVTIDPERGEAILTTDMEEVSQALTGTVASVSAAFNAGYGTGHYHLDLRFYSVALSRERLRTLAKQRDDSSASLAGSWRMDDGSGTVVTDYAAIPNHGAIAGTENVNFFWLQSDLGEPEQAGKLMDVTHGYVFNGLGTLTGDAPKFRYGYTDRLPPVDPGSGNPEWKVNLVRTQGVPLTITTDYTLPAPGFAPAGNVIELVGGSSEPITYNTGPGVAVYPGALLPELLEGIGERRAEIDRYEDVDYEAWRGLRALCPWPAGLHWAASAPVLAEVWGGALGSVGAHLRADRAARALPGMLLPPINPGPYGLGNFLEFYGGPTSGVTFPALPTLEGANVLNAVTIVLLTKVHNMSADPVAANLAQPCFQEFLSTLSPDGTTGLVCGVWAGADGGLMFGSPTIGNPDTGPGYPDLGVTHSHTFATRPLRSEEWWLFAFKLTASSGVPAWPFGGYQRTIYGAPFGAAAVVELASEGVIGTRTAGTQLRIGRGLAGSVAYAVVYDDDLMPADLTPMLTAPPPTTNALFYAALNEGYGNLTCRDAITGGLGTIEGARWCPALTIDADRSDAGKVTSIRDVRPLWQSVTRFETNQNPMADSDIAAGVTDRAEREHLRQESMEETASDRSTLDVYLRARDTDRDTPLVNAADARASALLTDRRLAPGMLGAEATVDERIYDLHLLDEVHVRSVAADLPNWTVWRIVARSPNAIEGDSAPAVGPSPPAGTIALWGGIEE